jgi:hypothetical protein
MGSRTTFAGIIRQRGMANASGNGKGTPGSFKAYVSVTFDPTQVATTETGVWLPAGALLLGAIIQGASTGGTSPTVDVGTVGGAQDDIIAEGDSETLTVAEVATASLIAAAAPLAADTQVTAGVGASAATGGTVTVLIAYVVIDDGVINS